MFFEQFEDRRLLATANNNYYSANLGETIYHNAWDGDEYLSPSNYGDEQNPNWQDAHGGASYSGEGSLNFSNFDGSFSFTAPYAVRLESFEYYVCDAAGCGFATVFIGVEDPNVNEPPTLGIFSRTIDEDTTLTLNPTEIMAGAWDPEGQPLTIVITGAHWGTVGESAGGNSVYTPPSNYHGSDIITYSIEDDENFINGQINVTILSINDGLPTAVDDLDYDHDSSLATSLVILAADGVLDNDLDADDELTAHLVTPPAHGTISLATNGGFEYSPDANFVGVDTFTYLANDSFADSDPATVNITVIKSRDVRIDAFQTDGTDLTVTYTVIGGNVSPFSINLFASFGGQTAAAPLQSVAAERTIEGPYTQTIPAQFADPYEDYQLVAMVDGLVVGQLQINESNEANNELPLAFGADPFGSFVVQEPEFGKMRHIYAAETADLMTLYSTGAAPCTAANSLCVVTRDPSLSRTLQGNPQGIYYDVTGDTEYSGSGAILHRGTVSQLDVDVLLYNLAHADHPWQSPALNLRWDVDNDGSIAPNDALFITNYVNTFGPRLLDFPMGQFDKYMDVNGDNAVSYNDANQVVNKINGGPGTNAALWQNPADARNVNNDATSNENDAKVLLAYLESALVPKTYPLTGLAGAVVRARGGHDRVVSSVTASGFRVRFFGGQGDDMLVGGIGHDVLEGRPGDDLLFGGGGNDLFNLEDLNDAPIPVGPFNLDAINEDDSNSGGTLVSALLQNKIIDVDDAGAFGADPRGMAVTAVDNTNGVWQYKLDNNSPWTEFGVPSSSAARLLSAQSNSLIRFVPTPNWHSTSGGTGVPPVLIFRAWDQDSGTAGATANVTSTGGITGFSATAATASITVNSVNDPPTLIAIADPVAITEQSGTMTIQLTGITAGGGETQTLTITANSSADLFSTLQVSNFNVAQGTATLTYTPKNALAGPATITVTVDDGGLSVQRTFTITVKPDLKLTGFRSNGTDLLFDYSVIGGLTQALKVTIYASPDGVTLGQPLQVIDDLNPSRDTYTGVVRPASFVELPEDHYLVAKIDNSNGLTDFNENDNLKRFAGGAYINNVPGGQKTFVVEGTDDSDNISVSKYEHDLGLVYVQYEDWIPERECIGILDPETDYCDGYWQDTENGEWVPRETPLEHPEPCERCNPEPRSETRVLITWDNIPTYVDPSISRINVFSRGGNDIVNVQGANASVFGGDGNDSLTTGAGNDLADGGDGDDAINTGAGNDFGDGGAGADDIDLGDGDDIGVGGEGADDIDGDSGDDLVIGDEDDTSIDGGDGDDNFYGGNGTNVSGGSGSDCYDDYCEDSWPASITLTLEEPDVGFEGRAVSIVGHISPPGRYYLDGTNSADYQGFPVETDGDGRFVITSIFDDDGSYSVDITACLFGTEICDTESTDVNVENVAPGLNVELLNGQVHGFVGEYQGAIPDVDTVTVTIDWGDDTEPEVINDLLAEEPSENYLAEDWFTSLAHTYADPTQSYTITVTATDDDGGSTIQTIETDVQVVLVTETIVSKSYIDTVTNLGEMPTPQASARLAAFAASIFVNPLVWDGDVTTPDADGEYRLRAELGIQARIQNGQFQWLTVSGSTQGGAELLGIYGTHNLKFKTERVSGSVYKIHWATWGRPNKLMEPGFVAVWPRSSKNIWHNGAIMVQANADNTLTFTTLAFGGSDFPSHKLWIGADLKQYIPQGPLSSLWRFEPTVGITFVTDDGTGPFLPFWE